MKKEMYSEELAMTIRDFLTKEDLDFSFDEERGLFEFCSRLENGSLELLHYFIEVNPTSYRVYAYAPFDVKADDKELMAALTEFVCRINYGQVFGNFELDVWDGEIRFKAFTDCDDRMPSYAILQNSVYFPALFIEAYAPGFDAIISRRAGAEDAAALCERHIDALMARVFGPDAPAAEDLPPEDLPTDGLEGIDLTESELEALLGVADGFAEDDPDADAPFADDSDGDDLPADLLETALAALAKGTAPKEGDAAPDTGGTAADPSGPKGGAA